METLTYILFVLILLVYVYVQVKSQLDRLSLLEDEIRAYYRKQELEVLSISKLTSRERIRYGVPLIPFVSFYQSAFSFFTSSSIQSVCRSVETRSASGSEQICYVELSASGAIREFDRYEF